MTAAMDGDAAREGVLEEMDADECMVLLATQDVGRLAVNAPMGPLVVPVNYRLAGDTIVFRSGAGTKLRALAGRPVSFQVDHVDHDRRVGWSVLARGRAREVSARQFEGHPVEPWVPRDRDHWVAVKIVAVTGRRIAVRPPTE